MLVRHFMTRELTTLSPDDRCIDAWKTFRKHKLRRAPVVKDGKLVGFVSDRDLFRALPRAVFDAEDGEERADAKTRIAEIMARDVVSIGSKAHLEEAANLMLERRIGGLPVVDGGKLVGIITETDLFRIFVKMISATRGMRITVQAQLDEEDEKRGDPAKLCLEKGIALSSLAGYQSPGGERMVVLHVDGARADELPEALRNVGFTLIDVKMSPEGA